MAGKKAAKQSDIDKDLQDLYNRAKQSEMECPHCKAKVQLGGDFSEMARAMEIRVKYEAIKSRGGGPATPDFFSEED